MPTLFGVLAFSATCGGEPPTEPAVELRNLIRSAELPLNAVVGKAIVPAPTVRAMANGSPLAGVEVSWTPSAGSVSANKTTTDAAGLSSVTWTLGPAAGPQSLSAQASGTGSVVFNINAAADRPAIIRFAPDSAVIDAVSDSVRLQPTVTDQHNNPVNAAIEYAVDSVAIGAITSGSYVKAVRNGIARITATADTARGTMRVIVRQLATRVTVSPASLAFTAVGDTANVLGKAFDRLGTELPSAFTYTVVDTTVASVTAGGRVTAKKNGTTYVRATADAGLRDSTIVAVTQQPTKVAVTPRTVAIRAIGDTVQLQAAASDRNNYVVPSAAVTWQTLDTNVVFLLSDGRVISRREGTARVIARNGTLADTTTVTIQQVAASVVLTAPRDTLNIGDTLNLTLTAADSNGVEMQNPAWSWSTSNSGTATVAKDTVVAVATGLVTISVSGHGVTGSKALSVLYPPFTNVSAGGAHTCALSGGVDSGRMFCWGWNNDGQLGDGTTTARTRPTPVATALRFTDVFAGYFHTCGIVNPTGTTNFQAYCWGRNDQGQLGDGTTQRRLTPTVVAGSLSLRGITIGNTHTCAIARSPSPSPGTVYCWGNNLNGQVGDGSFAQRNVPTAVSGGLLFSVVAAGSEHNCGVTTTNDAYCWGDNLNGALGDGTTSVNRGAPTAVTGGLKFSSITAGYFHTCAVQPLTGFVAPIYCWGLNGSGRLGDGTTISRSAPVRVGTIALSFVEAGFDFNCGIVLAPSFDFTSQAFSDVVCWGRNTTGQLGDGTTTDRASPVAVSGMAFWAVRSGGYHTCGMRAGDRAWHCWGSNATGQLGDRTTLDRVTPVLVNRNP